MFISSGIKILLFLLIFPGPAGASTATGDLQKMGKGTVYYLKFIKVYDASLYSSDVNADKNILSGEVSKCLHLEYDVDLEKNVFIESANEILGRQFPPEVLAEFSEDIDRIHQNYQDVQKGDSYTLCYSRDTYETSLAFNDSVVVSITSPGFAEIYFSIWLGKKAPLDKSLRDDLLSG